MIDAVWGGLTWFFESPLYWICLCLVWMYLAWKAYRNNRRAIAHYRDSLAILEQAQSLNHATTEVLAEIERYNN